MRSLISLKKNIKLLFEYLFRITSTVLFANGTYRTHIIVNFDPFCIVVATDFQHISPWVQLRLGCQHQQIKKIIFDEMPKNSAHQAMYDNL